MAVGILLRLLVMARSAADEPKPLHALRDANSCPPQLDFGAAAPAATLLPPATAAPLGCDDCCYELLPEHFAAVAGYQNRPTPYKSKTPPIVCGSSVSPRSPALPAADCWFPALEPCEHFVFAIKQGDELRTPNADCETAQKRWLTAMSGPWQSALGWPTKWPTVSLGGPATWDGKAGSAHLVIVMTRKGWLLAGRKDIGGFDWVEEERCTRGVECRQVCEDVAVAELEGVEATGEQAALRSAMLQQRVRREGGEHRGVDTCANQQQNKWPSGEMPWPWARARGLLAPACPGPDCAVRNGHPLLLNWHGALNWQDRAAVADAMKRLEVEDNEWTRVDECMHSMGDVAYLGGTCESKWWISDEEDWTGSTLRRSMTAAVHDDENYENKPVEWTWEARARGESSRAGDPSPPTSDGPERRSWETRWERSLSEGLTEAAAKMELRFYQKLVREALWDSEIHRLCGFCLKGTEWDESIRETITPPHWGAHGQTFLSKVERGEVAAVSRNVPPSL